MLNRDDIGVLAPGFAADLVAFDLPLLVERHNRLAAELVGGAVDCCGRPVYPYPSRRDVLRGGNRESLDSQALA